MQAVQTQVQKKCGFVACGVRCAATLHLPEHAQTPLPAVLMVHGWGGTQLMLVTDFIKRFNKNGYAVLTFDFPGWGHSEGLPRNTINPWKRVKVAEAALAYLKSLPEIDDSNVVLWGSSFGGGHVIELAAEHPELKGVISQVPMLDGIEAVKAVPLTRMLRFGVDVALDVIHPFQTRYLPIAAEEGGYATMDRDGVERLQAWMEEHLPHEFDNRVSARSMLTMGLYRPFKKLKKLAIPTLIIGATRDTVAPFIEKKIKSLNPELIEIETLDANHFDPYLEPWFGENIRIQEGFLKRVLCV